MTCFRSGASLLRGTAASAGGVDAPLSVEGRRLCQKLKSIRDIAARAPLFSCAHAPLSLQNVLHGASTPRRSAIARSLLPLRYRVSRLTLLSSFLHPLASGLNVQMASQLAGRATLVWERLVSTDPSWAVETVCVAAALNCSHALAFVHPLTLLPPFHSPPTCVHCFPCAFSAAQQV